MKTDGKILLILNLPPPFGGGEIRSEYLYQYLIGNNNYIIVSHSRKKSNKSSQGKFTLYNISYGFKIIAKTIYYIILHKPKKIYLGIPKQFNSFLKTAITISIASFFKVKIYGELAGNSFAFLEKINYQKRIGLFFLRKLSELRVLGQNVKNNLSQYEICKLVVIDNGIYVPPEKIDQSTKKFSNPIKLLFVGAMNYSKGIKNIIESMYLLKQDNISFHLHMMGEWSDRLQEEEILTYIRQNELNSFITFHGLITTKLKWEIYNECAILVHPTYWDGQPLVILEAMGCGLAVISTNIGAIPDTMINNYNGIILQENNSMELKNAIIRFYNNKPFLKEVAKNNIKTYHERFTINSYLLRMKKWLEE